MCACAPAPSSVRLGLRVAGPFPIIQFPAAIPIPVVLGPGNMLLMRRAVS